MANSLRTNPIYIDVFTAAIDLSTYYPDEMLLDSIEWSKPTSVNHYGVVLSGGATGVTVFDEHCTVANQSLIKYFHGTAVKSLYVPVAGTNLLGSGSIIITMRR